MERLGLQPREDDYYATRAPMSSKRLAEMTLESAFDTRQLYAKLGWRLWILTGIAAAGLFVLLAASATWAVPETSGLLLSEAVFLAIPVLLSLDFLGPETGAAADRHCRSRTRPRRDPAAGLD